MVGPRPVVDLIVDFFRWYSTIARFESRPMVGPVVDFLNRILLSQTLNLVPWLIPSLIPKKGFTIVDFESRPVVKSLIPSLIS